MPIVITPIGELMDDQTGRTIPIPEGSNPADFPMVTMDEVNAIRTRAIDPMSRATVGEMARENIPANMDMGLDSMMPKRGAGESTELMSVEQKIMALMDMGLTEGEAIDAIAMEESAGSVNPQMFAGTPSARATQGAMGNMGVLGGVPANMPMPMPRGSTNMGMPEDAMVAQRMNQVDTSGMSPQQIEMLRMGRDPFAEGMIGR